MFNNFSIPDSETQNYMIYPILKMNKILIWSIHYKSIINDKFKNGWKIKNQYKMQKQLKFYFYHLNILFKLQVCVDLPVQSNQHIKTIYFYWTIKQRIGGKYKDLSLRQKCAGKEYEKINKKIGDVQPSNIVINQDGQIKIISVDSWPMQMTNFEKIIQSTQNKSYLAPQEYNEIYIKKGQYPNNVNISLAQVFSIGLTLLEAATLQDCSTLYINPTYEFDQNGLKKIQNNLKLKYSSYLIKILNQMTQLIANQRPTCGQLYSILSPYDEEILNLQEFEFDRNQSILSYNNYIKNDKSKIKINYWNVSSFFDKTQIKPFAQISQMTQPPSYNNYQIPYQSYSNPNSNQNIATNFNRANIQTKSNNYQFQYQPR